MHTIFCWCALQDLGQLEVPLRGRCDRKLTRRPYTTDVVVTEGLTVVSLNKSAHLSNFSASRCDLQLASHPPFRPAFSAKTILGAGHASPSMLQHIVASQSVVFTR